MNPQIAQLAELPWQKVMGVALGACVLYYFLFFDNGSAIDGAIAASQQQLIEEQSLLKKTEEKMKDLEAFREELNNQEAQVREVMNFLPKQLNVSELTSMVQERATQAGMRVAKTEIDSKVVRIDFYEAIRMKAEMVGTFAQVTKFLSLLSKLPRLVTVENIELNMIGASNDATRLKFTTTLVGFRFVEEEANKLSPGGANAPGQ